MKNTAWKCHSVGGGSRKGVAVVIVGRVVFVVVVVGRVVAVVVVVVVVGWVWGGGCGDGDGDGLDTCVSGCST